jgi:hypothetical protein
MYMRRIGPSRGKASEKENAWISENALTAHQNERSNQNSPTLTESLKWLANQTVMKMVTPGQIYR